MNEPKAPTRTSDDETQEKRRQERHNDREDRLQEGLEETFPASDTPSVSQPTRTGEPDERRKPRPSDKK
jgi:hypothetical protein